MRRRQYMAVIAAAASILIVACKDTPSAPAASPFTGMSQVEANDSSTSPGPQPAPSQPGAFHGYIFGLAQNAGQNGDTLSSATALSGVKVTAYPYLNEVDAEGRPKAGPEAASTTTNSAGLFQLPTLPAGTYVVAIAPQSPNDAVWIGGWTVATTSATSNDHAWWIYLPRK
ncbi:MAG TPA: hypothetical protein VJ867_17740 [Gemmatimonadaceae bacterium]|nr:hypothetical protein [Gemmatimonadaceae bacterium]